MFLVASKSGSTIEVTSLERHFWSVMKTLVPDDPGRHFVAITDPETSLAALAATRGYRRTFINPPDIGGRYSALSLFGLVPAALMGIDVDRTIVTVFGVGGAMAGVAGALWGLVFPSLNFFSGFLPGIKAFTSAVLGGIGNIVGAMIGGISIGIFESVGPSLVLAGYDIPAFSQLKDVVAYAALVLVLIFRPTGIMGVDLGKKKA